MRLPFLDRQPELERIARALAAAETNLVVVYGRRRLGKSRLLDAALGARTAVRYTGDERASALQREAVAAAIGEQIPGFASVSYPQWADLLERWQREAPRHAVLALDEFPAMVAVAPELPSLLQKVLDRPDGRRPWHLVLCGSSQGLMHGLVLDGSAPLFGRAREILKIAPLDVPWIARAFPRLRAAELIDQWAVWGGVPRYWELASEHRSWGSAVEALVLDPLGVLHREPERILRDDVREVVRCSSLLALVGQGVHRLSELGARLGTPGTSLSRPLGQLVELGFLQRMMPFQRSARDTKLTWYVIADPFLRFWFRCVEPNRSRLGSGALRAVARDVAARKPQIVGAVFEDLARSSAGRLRIHGHRWTPGGAWWGRDARGQELEIDVMAQAVDDPDLFLVGESKHRCVGGEVERLLANLDQKARRCPALAGKRWVTALWVLRGQRLPRSRSLIGAEAILAAGR